MAGNVVGRPRPRLIESDEEFLERETKVIRNDGVGGSNPSCGTTQLTDLTSLSFVQFWRPIPLKLLGKHRGSTPLKVVEGGPCRSHYRSDAGPY
jgi:hypothetical protein